MVKLFTPEYKKTVRGNGVGWQTFHHANMQNDACEPISIESLETAKPDWMLATLQEALLQAFEQSEETYGSRRFSLAVTRLGLKSGRFKTRCLVREIQLKGKCPKAKIWRKQAVVFMENNANQQCPLQPDTIWAGDFRAC